MTREVLLWQIGWLLRHLGYQKIWWAIHDEYGEIGE